MNGSAAGDVEYVFPLDDRGTIVSFATDVNGMFAYVSSLIYMYVCMQKFVYNMFTLE